MSTSERMAPSILLSGGLVGANLHPIPAPVAVLDLGLRHRHRVDHLGDLPVEIGDVDVDLDVVERTPEVAVDDVQDASRLGRETTDPALASRMTIGMSTVASRLRGRC
jgi:hypothetical protein